MNEVVLLGKVQMTPKGEYNPDAQYAFLDLVTINGSSYLAKKPSINVPVTSTEYWMEIAHKGETGDAAGFGVPTAEVTGLPAGSNPTVSVTSEGTDLSKIFHFLFGIPKGEKGNTGNGIQNIEKTGTEGNVDTYTITYTDGTQTSFNVTNGINGTSAGFGTPTVSVDANIGTPYVEITATGSDTAKVFNFSFHNLKGVAGISPTVTVTDIEGGHRITITDATGSHVYDAVDGTSSSVTVTDITGGHHVTITDAAGDHEFDVMDGVSPEVTIEEIEGGHSVTITDADHPDGQTFNVMDGQDGASDAGEVTYDPTETYADGTVGKALTAQSSRIAQLASTKADKGVVDRHSKEIQFLMDAQKGVTAEIVQDNTEAYSKAVPAYTGATAKLVDVKKLGGKSTVESQIVPFDAQSSQGTINNGDGSFTVITRTGEYYALSYNYDDVIIGHKYLLYTKNGIDEKLYTRIENENGNPITSKAKDVKEIISKRTNGKIYLRSYQLEADITVYPKVFDLTRILGIGASNITTVEQATEALRDVGIDVDAYIDYGTYIISADCEGADSTGFNIWDEQWELGDISATTGENVSSSSVIRTTNYIPIIGGMTYFNHVGDGIGSNALRPRFYDANKRFIGTTQQDGSGVTYNRTFIPPVEARFMRFTPQSSYGTAYNNDICFNVSQPDTTKNPHDGQYLPYLHDVMTIPQGLRTAHPLRSAGTVHDEYNFERKFTCKKVGTSKINELTWIGGTDGKFQTDSLIGVIKERPTNAGHDNISSETIAVGEYSHIINNLVDNKMVVIWSDSASHGRIIVRCNKFSNLQSFLDGIGENHLYYELAAPVYYYDPTSPELAVNGGTVVPDATHIVDTESYFPSNTLLHCEDGGTVTFHQSATEFPIQNVEDFYYDLNEEASA